MTCSCRQQLLRVRSRACVAVCCLIAIASCEAWADTATSGGTGSGGSGPLSASARLDFVLNLGEFIFFRIGSTAYPTASPTIDTVSVGSTIPPGGVVPAPGNSVPVIWDGTTPGSPSGVASLPVEVRSNAGQVRISALTLAPLTSGANTIPMSSVDVTSDDARLPAPPIVNFGFSAPVNVTGTAFSNLVTVRAANWTFSYSSPTPAPASGVYTGQIIFTAFAP